MECHGGAGRTEGEDMNETKKPTVREDVNPATAYGTSPCCSEAERVACICRASWRCRRHGWAWCVGTHD